MFLLFPLFRHIVLLIDLFIECIVSFFLHISKERFGFLPNLSIADLLFNMGPESLLVLQKCVKNGL